MRKNFVTYDGKSTVISACDEFLDMPYCLPPAVGLWLGVGHPVPRTSREGRYNDKLLFSVVVPRLETVILSEGDARVEGSHRKQNLFMTMVFYRYKEILRRGQRPCSG